MTPEQILEAITLSLVSGRDHAIAGLERANKEDDHINHAYWAGIRVEAVNILSYLHMFSDGKYGEPRPAAGDQT